MLAADRSSYLTCAPPLMSIPLLLQRALPTHFERLAKNPGDSGYQLVTIKFLILCRGGLLDRPLMQSIEINNFLCEVNGTLDASMLPVM